MIPISAEYPCSSQGTIPNQKPDMLSWGIWRKHCGLGCGPRRTASVPCVNKISYLSATAKAASLLESSWSPAARSFVRKRWVSSFVDRRRGVQDGQVCSDVSYVGCSGPNRSKEWGGNGKDSLRLTAH